MNLLICFGGFCNSKYILQISSLKENVYQAHTMVLTFPKLSAVASFVKSLTTVYKKNFRT